jgi:hypothetical protein
MLVFKDHRLTAGQNASSMMNARKARRASNSIAWILAVVHVGSTQTALQETTLLSASAPLAMKEIPFASVTKFLRSSPRSQLKPLRTPATHHRVDQMQSAGSSPREPYAPASEDILVIPMPTVDLNALSTLIVLQTRPVEI